MDAEKSWERFIISGKINDYLGFVNSCKENEIIEGSRDTFYNRGAGNKGNENRGE